MGYVACASGTWKTCNVPSAHGKHAGFHKYFIAGTCDIIITEWPITAEIINGTRQRSGTRRDVSTGMEVAMPGYGTHK